MKTVLQTNKPRFSTSSNPSLLTNNNTIFEARKVVAEYKNPQSPTGNLLKNVDPKLARMALIAIKKALKNHPTKLIKLVCDTPANQLSVVLRPS